MNVHLPQFILVFLLLVASGCQDPPEKRSMTGSYNYSGTLGDEGGHHGRCGNDRRPEGLRDQLPLLGLLPKKSGGPMRARRTVNPVNAKHGAEYGGSASSLPSANTLMQIACAK
jgi:hypothetical protein